MVGPARVLRTIFSRPHFIAYHVSLQEDPNGRTSQSAEDHL